MSRCLGVRQLALDGPAATQELLALAADRSPQSPGRSGLGVVGGGGGGSSLDRPTLRYQRYHSRETDGESSRRPMVMVKGVVAE